MSLQARFEQFHRDNPGVYRLLVKLTRDLRNRGHLTVSIKMVYEVARWEHYMTTTDPQFKLNNSFTSRYARLLMEQEADLKGIFDTRRLGDA